MENTTNPATTEERVQPANPAIGSIADTRAKVKVEVTDAEKMSFYKSFLSDKPYTQQVELFGGKFTAGLRTLSVQENNDIFKQIVMDQNQGVPKSDEAYFITLVTYRVALSLAYVNDEPWMPEVVNTVADDKIKGLTYVRSRAKGFDNWPAYKLQALLEAYRVFEQKVIHLTEQVNDASFWNPEK